MKRYIFSPRVWRAAPRVVNARAGLCLCRAMIFLAAVLGAVGIFTSAGVAYTGVSGFDLLALDGIAGARAAAMGSAHTAEAGDSASLYYNPAGLKDLPRVVGFTYSKWLADTGYGAVTYGYKDFAASLAYFDGGLMELNYSNRPSETRIAQRDFLLGAGIGRGWLGLGWGIKYLNSSFAEETTASVVAVDFGRIYEIKPFGKDMKLGVSMRNLGTGFKQGGKAGSGWILPLYIPTGLIGRYYDYDYLPLQLRTGLSWSMGDKIKSVNADVIWNINDTTLQLASGLQYLVSDNVALRAGFKTGDKLLIITGGLGTRFADKEIDYAFNYNLDLGLLHFVTFSMKL